MTTSPKGQSVFLVRAKTSITDSGFTLGPCTASEMRTSIPFVLMIRRGFFHSCHESLYVAYFPGSGFAIRFASGNGGGVAGGGTELAQP